MLLKDARIYQILFLSLFLILGIVTRDWTLQPGIVLTIIATCLLTQWGIGMVRSQKSEVRSQESVSTIPHSPYLPLALYPTPNSLLSTPLSLPTPFSSLLSALITSIGLSLLLRADHYSTAMLAGVLAILSKFLIRVQDKHVFNPANFGIVAALVLTPDAWVSPGQWGEEGWYVLLFLGCGGLVLQKVGRWDTTAAFLGSYAVLEAIRNLWLGWTWDVWLHRLMSGSLLLFALFMITDPRTIPNARIGRLIWAGAIALLTFILRNYFFLTTAVFWALFALAPLSILLDWLFPADRFTWQEPEGSSHQKAEAQVKPG